MISHKNARLTYLRRLEMVLDITGGGCAASQAAARHGVSTVTARKWLGRHLVEGAAGLMDKSSRPQRSPRTLEPHVAQTIVSRVLRHAGLSRLSDLRPDEPVQRYERETPGELLHIDIKKLGRFDRIGHRITGDYSQRGRGLGWEYVFVAIDDHSRIAFTQMYPDEKQGSAVAFLRAAVQYFAGLRVTIERVLTDNGPAFHSAAFGQTCQALGIAQKFTRAYRPQTNGKAERFIQSALREWAYGRAYESSEQRRAALPAWTHFYNWHRPHHGIDVLTPIPRL
jgi:transposase InsO family protein